LDFVSKGVKTGWSESYEEGCNSKRPVMPMIMMIIIIHYVVGSGEVD
jgi:hypothetical protein